MKKRTMILFIEFFENQDPKKIEDQLRWLVKKKRFPRFQTLLTMVNYKNLKQRNIKEEFPLMVEPDDIKKKEV